MRIAAILILIVLLVPIEAKAGFEVQPIFAFDAKVVAAQYQGNDAMVGVRFRHSRSLLGLELSCNLDHGVSAMILIDTVRVWRLRFHLDVGIFYPAMGSQMSVPEVPRSFDFVIGVGVEARLYKNLIVIFDWRAYLPDPRLIGYYGDFYVPLYQRALKEGPWFLGLGLRF